jgi:DNA-binding CsgD family transcriptional regulator
VAQQIALIGRDTECALIRTLLDNGPTSGGAALTIRGTAGVGKSALLEWAADTAGDRFQLLRAVGTAAEFGLPFAALHQIVRPILPLSLRLPRHRRTALGVAFGGASDSPPDLYSVAMAALDLLAEAASGNPLLILLDDVQWMDLSSQQALGFVGRRVASDHIVLLAARRDGQEDSPVDSAWQEIELRPLDRGAARQLLEGSAGGLDQRTRALVLDVADGNPLALLELPRTVGLTGETIGADRLPLTRRLERSFAARIGDLDANTQTALAIAALSDSDDLLEIVAATALAAPTATPEVLDPAVAAGLIIVKGLVVRFSHPLIRSSVYQRLSPTARRAGHAALAEVSTSDPERTTWHRASAALHPDSALAASLEDSADRAIRRGATANAIHALERSAQLSVDVADRRQRVFRAAALAYSAGRSTHADRLRTSYREHVASDADLLHHEWLGELAGTDRGGEGRVELLVDLADRAHKVGDDDLAMQFLRAAALRCWNFCPDRPAGKTVIAAADRFAIADAPARAVLRAYGSPFENAEDVLEVISSVAPALRDASMTYQLGHAAACVGAFEVSEALFGEAVDSLRSEGRLHTLGTALVLMSWSALHRGRWSTTISAAVEGGRLCAETAQPFWHSCALAAHAVVSAERGDVAAAEELIQLAEDVATAHSFAAAEAVILIARAASATAQGHHDRAFAHLTRLHDPADPAHHPVHALWSLASLADAAALSGDVEAGRRTLAALGSHVRATRSPAGRMNLVYAEAVLATDDNIEARLRAAIVSITMAWPVERSRLLLVYGTWLRRQRRARESREYLRAARDGFERLGATPSAERARVELRAAGEGSTVPVPDAWDSLSPQEMQIASMLTDGLTNREIGERLFISHRTVGAHLYRMFPKLGISSRNELLRLVAKREPA